MPDWPLKSDILKSFRAGNIIHECLDYCLVTRRACISVPYLFARVIEPAFFSYLPRNTTAAWQKGLRDTITICSEARLYKRRVSLNRDQDPTINPFESASPSNARGRLCSAYIGAE